jgi:large subunit ribosomal protein L13
MVQVGSKTYSAKEEDIERKWYLIDARGKNLGRLSTRIAKILRGKDKVTFTPHVDCGDFVVVINAGEIEVTGNKKEDKLYYSHSGYTGNLKETNLEEMLLKNPGFVLKHSVKGMLPHNTLGRRQLKKLKVYGGEDHPHKSQKPEKIEI